VTTKVCAECKRELDRSEFGTRKAGSGNIVPRAYCRACERERAKRSYDPEYARTRYQRVKKERPDDLRKWGKAARAKVDPERRSARAREWRERNPERVSEYARTYKESHRELVASWQRSRDARQLEATLVRFTQAQLVQRLSMFPGCWMCGGPKEHIDHVKPLSKGGAHMLCNLRPACAKCNLTKKDKWPLGSLAS